MSSPTQPRLQSPPCGAGVPSWTVAAVGQHRSYLVLASVALAAAGLLCLAGCQTARAPTTVAPPPTGMIGQPAAAYGSWATPTQGAAYPPTASPPALPNAPPLPTAPPFPGPATQWQSAAPTAPPPANSWSWSQPAAPAQPGAPTYGAPTYGAPPPGVQPPAVPNQVQQYATQPQAQPQQWANQPQQSLAAQQQQYANHLQNTANQYQQGFNNQVQQGLQSAQQQANAQFQQAQQQVTAQMPQMQPGAPPTTSWNPFATSAQSLPPARATPATTIPRY